MDRESSYVAVSLAEAFRAEYPALHRFLRRRVGLATADDLAAETFAVAFARWESFDKSRALRPWLYGIASNLAHHHWRAEERKLRAYARTGIDPVTAELDDAPGRLDAQEQRRSLAAALAELRSEDRDILLLHAWAELSDAEIAAALLLPVGTVKSRLHRTRERLGNYLAERGQQSEIAEVVPEREASR